MYLFLLYVLKYHWYTFILETVTTTLTAFLLLLLSLLFYFYLYYLFFSFFLFFFSKVVYYNKSNKPLPKPLLHFYDRNYSCNPRGKGVESYWQNSTNARHKQTTTQCLLLTSGTRLLHHLAETERRDKKRRGVGEGSNHFREINEKNKKKKESRQKTWKKWRK